MNKTKIEWCDYTWNPVTGCLHGCEYCYAKKQARRFKGFEPRCGGEVGLIGKSIWETTHNKTLHVFDEQPMKRTRKGLWQKAAYPYEFDPTFHRYRFNEPWKLKKPSNIFVCSMADLFGDWVPDEWIQGVFKACETAPQHRYLFLTKNPKRYKEFEYLYQKNMWFGMSYTHLIDGIIPGALEFCEINQQNTFMSLEPILEPLHFGIMRHYIKWAILGAETGNRKGKIIPKREWIVNIVNECHAANVPVFMKNSLKEIWGEPLIQEYPW